MRFWRISNFADLSGAGGALHASRWNRKGLPVVYLADHPSTSLLETLVHFRNANLPDTFQLLAIDAPDSARIEKAALPKDWMSKARVTQKLGSEFLKAGEFALLSVPSVVMPQAGNFLLNPAHPDAALFRIAQTWRYPFDSRLLT
jgi:RES domain-containing protein